MSLFAHLYKWLKSRFKDRYTHHHLMAGVFFAIIVVTFPFLWKSGSVVFGDIDFGFEVKGYIQRMDSTWNEIWSNPNFFNLGRLPIIAPLYWFARFINLQGGDFFGLFVGIILWTSAWTMYRLSHTVLREETNKHLHGPIVSVIAFITGAIYAFNPWVFMRIQHIYLLVGYAIFPMLYLILFKITHDHIPKSSELKKRNYFTQFWMLLGGRKGLRNIVYICIVWGLSIAAIHYLFYCAILIGLWGFYQFIICYAKQDYTRQLAIFIRYLVMGVFVLILLAYFFFPQVYSVLNADITPNNVNTIDSISLFSRNSQFVNVIYLLSYWWPMFDYATLPVTFWVGGGTILFVMVAGHFFSRLRRSTLFWILWTIIFAIFSTGTKGPFAEFIIWLVFHSPISSFMGFIFRDPNKLIGLMAVGYSLLFGLGLGKIYAALQSNSDRIQNFFKAINALTGRDYPVQKIASVIFLLPVILIIGGVGMYLYPVGAIFSDFYDPVDPPESYKTVFDVFEDRDESARVMFLPRNEDIISPGLDYASAIWNPFKPTSGIDIFSSPVRTYNTTEGSVVYMAQMYRYLSETVEKTRSSAIWNWLSSLGVNAILYHADIQGFEEEHEASIRTLSQQKYKEWDYQKHSFWHIFSTPVHAAPFHINNNAVFSSGGFSLISYFSELPLFDFQNYTWLWVNGDIEQTSTQLELAEKGDIANFRFTRDIVLGSIDPKHFISPYDFTEYSDAFTRWGRNRVTSNDWLWHIEHLNIDNWNWDFDYGKGLAFTYAPAMLNVKPHQNPFRLGTVRIKTEDFIGQDELFFVSEDEEVLEVKFAPTSIYDDLPFVQGEVSHGNEKYWKVVTSRFLEVKERNAYTFTFTMSGRGTNRIHGKVKYYDRNDEEIAVSYVSAPHNVPTFDFVKFTGKFVTPPEAEKIKIQLWSHQRPQEKLYWWIHDIEIRDLEEYVIPNILTMKTHVEEEGEYRLFARVFHNERGGSLGLNINDETVGIKTKTDHINQFFWEDLGTVNLKKGVQEIGIENIYGFNAVNTIAIIPKEEYLNAEEASREFFEKTRSVYAFEAWEDMLQYGNVQSKRYDVNMTSGKEVRFNNGVLTAAFDIPESGQYDLYVDTLQAPNLSYEHDIEVFIEAENQVLTYQKELPLSSFLSKKNHLYVGRYGLPEGKVQIKVTVKDNKKSLFNTNELHEFKYQDEWTERETYLDTLGSKERNTDCCDCVSLGENYMDVNYDPSTNTAKTTLTQGCSCWWVITASEIAPVYETEEYLLQFSGRSDFARRSHYKIIFLDEDKVFLDYYIVKDTPISNAFDWTFIEEIIEVPEGAAFAQFQVWGRQNKFTQSSYAVKDLLFKRWLDLPLVDGMVMYEVQDETDNLSWLFDAPNTEATKVSSPSRHVYEIEVPELRTEDEEDQIDNREDQVVYLQIQQSYNSMWRLRHTDNQGNQQELKPVAHLGVQNAFPILKTTKKVEVRFSPQEWFQKGKVISITSLSISGLILCILYIAERRRERIQQQRNKKTPDNTDKKSKKSPNGTRKNK